MSFSVKRTDEDTTVKLGKGSPVKKPRPERSEKREENIMENIRFSPETSSRPKDMPVFETDFRSLANDQKVDEEFVPEMEPIEEEAPQAPAPEDYTNMYMPSDNELDNIFHGSASDTSRSSMPSIRPRRRRKRDYSSETDLESDVSLHEDEEKAFFIHMLKKYSKKEGIHVNTHVLNMETPLKKIVREYTRVKTIVDVEGSIVTQRQWLVNGCTFIEWFSPFGNSLDGWSDQVFNNMEDYDSIFEEIHKKYGHRVSGIDPLVKLGASLASSAFMYSRAKNMYERKNKVEEVFKDVPKDTQDSETQDEMKLAFEETIRQMGNVSETETVSMSSRNTNISHVQEDIDDDEDSISEDSLE